MKLARSLLKLGLGGGAVYFVVNQGVFSHSQSESIGASKKIAESIPGFEPYLQKIPSVMSKQELINYWNSGVKITVSALASLPDDTKDATSRGFHYLQEELKNQMNAKK
ncbi:uncharacterized protein LOC129221413 [Uloborus diversus]|uniref:uncharacterized protein LOC129221413 n=1 Tax=Uloborus diversus TaxID=327109 RepID=UPI00240A6206|nr:uncharacterized protein LOC129221413 [Uloborus diversus]